MEFLALLYLPVIALLVWSAWRGNQTERLVFFVNLTALWASAIWLFGYPALIIPALAVAGGFLLFLMVATVGDDLFHRPARLARPSSVHAKT